jgi:hypothetical protein
MEKKPPNRLLSILRSLKIAAAIALVVAYAASKRFDSRTADISTLSACALFLVLSLSMTLVEWKAQGWRFGMGVVFIVTTAAALLFGFLATTGAFK